MYFTPPSRALRVPPPQQVGRFAERHLGRSLQFVGANCVRPTQCDVISRNGQDRSLRTKWNFRGRAGACSRRLCPLREGAVKCAAFDWGRETSRYFLFPSVFCLRQKPPPAFRKRAKNSTISLRHALCACHLPLRGRNIRIAATPLIQIKIYTIL